MSVGRREGKKDIFQPKSLLIALPTKRPFSLGKKHNYEKSNGLIYKLILDEKCVHKFLYIFFSLVSKHNRKDVNSTVFSVFLVAERRNTTSQMGRRSTSSNEISSSLSKRGAREMRKKSE